MFEKLKYWWINRSVQKSKEPLLRIVSDGIDTNGAVKLKLVWNDLFIRHIKAHGFVGDTDEQCVQFYIASLVHSRQIEESQPLDHIRNG